MMGGVRRELASAKRELARMQRDRRDPVRRVIVVSGYRAHERMARVLASALRMVVTRPESIAFKGHASSGSFETSAQMVRGAIERAWGAVDELDFVGVSMGGLLGRWMAMPEHGGLPIARLFAISSPHRGADAAKIATFDDAARFMRAGSAGLAELDAALGDAPYEMRCYARTRDWWVGTANLAPRGHGAVTVRTPWWEPGHFMASYDVRIIADVARHVRGEGAWLEGE